MRAFRFSLALDKDSRIGFWPGRRRADNPLAVREFQLKTESAGELSRPNRDSIIHGVRIETDWSQKPPVQTWRRPVDQAGRLSRCATIFLYEEQRGDNEVVSCYNVTTGQPVWKHNDSTRFEESNAGAGPRGTPTLSNGRVYTLGGTGILNALDARTGSVVWSRNAASDTKVKVPHWGFAGSPLVVGDIVIVATAGALAGYDIATGNSRWVGPTSRGGYSSPQLLTLGGVAQVVLLNGDGAISVSPTDGTALWKYKWDGDGIVQPAVTADGDVLIGSGSGMAGVGLVRVQSRTKPADGPPKALEITRTQPLLQ